ncbi:MAG: winged helix-turn-helix transcriptional regulator [Chitinophagaceae bacterium]|nr:winged helix-turn-helix transcriptional regulator [Chitinophagaceae bacterium]
MNTSESKYSQCLYFSSNALARKVEKLAQESWKPVGLSPSHAYLLMIVIEDPAVQPGTLARELQLQPSTITRLIEKLEEKKLVLRITEGKATNVYPTPRAKEMYSKLKACVNHFYTSHAAILGKEESTKMVRNMNKLADKL